MSTPKTPFTQKSSNRGGREQTRSLLLIAGIVALVAILAGVIVIVAGGGDDDHAGPTIAEPAGVPLSDAGVATCTASLDDTTSSGAPSSDAVDLPKFPTDDIYKPVVVSGDPVASFAEEIQSGAIADSALCTPVPVLDGYDYEGDERTIDPATDGATLVVFLAHWCPHCNAEVPVLNEWRESGDVPENLTVIGVSTAVTSDRPNFPPDEWLDSSGWQWPVLADDAEGTALHAYGGTSFPTMVLVDADGLVRWRASGELAIEDIQTAADDVV